MSSFDVIRILKREVDFKKIGHGGTLDPLAEGLIRIGVGRGTKAVWDMGGEKEYVAEFYFDAESDTLDLTGSIARHGEFLYEEGISLRSDSYVSELNERLVGFGEFFNNGAVIDSQALQKVIDTQFIGEISQVPPKYSAKKIDGVRAYELARTDASIEMKECQVVIHSIDVLEVDGARVSLRISCGQGTYIRSLGDDIARALGFEGGVMTRLVRERV